MTRDRELLDLFRRFGAQDHVGRVATGESDEAIFVVSPTDILRTRVTELTVALQERLGLKVWITTAQDDEFGPVEEI